MRTSPWALPLVLLSRSEQAQQRYFQIQQTKKKSVSRSFIERRHIEAIRFVAFVEIVLKLSFRVSERARCGS
jgi:hypothetical protein